MHLDLPRPHCHCCVGSLVFPPTLSESTEAHHKGSEDSCLPAQAVWWGRTHGAPPTQAARAAAAEHERREGNGKEPRSQDGKNISPARKVLLQAPTA